VIPAYQTYRCPRMGTAKEEYNDLGTAGSHYVKDASLQPLPK